MPASLLFTKIHGETRIPIRSPVPCRSRRPSTAIRGSTLSCGTSLPDNEKTLESWARRFSLFLTRPFRLIENVGEDCPGANQFVTPERLNDMRDESSHCEIEWLNENDIAGGWRPCARSTPHGAQHRTQANSALRARSLRQLSSLRTANGEFLRANRQPGTR